MFPSRVWGGAEAYALTIGKGAVAAGWDVHAGFPVCAGTESLRTEFLCAGIAVHPVDLDESNPRGREYDPASLARNLGNAWRTAGVLRAVRPDVVHIGLPWPTFCYGSMMALSVLRCPTVVTFHLLPEHIAISKRRQRAYRRLRSRGQRWLAISEYSRGQISRVFGLEREDIALIRNGVRVTRATPPETREAIRESVRREFNLAASCRILLTVSRLVEQKGYTDLIPTIARVVHEHPDVRFMWVGDGEQRTALEASLSERGLAACVIFTGVRSDVERLMQASDLFVFPTRYEGLPFTLLEAMAADLPVIASDASSIPEVIETDRQGRLFPVGDSQALEAAMLAILQSPERARQQAAHARQRVMEFSQERMVDRTLALLESTAGLASTRS